MASGDQQVRAAGQGITESDAPATEKEERDVASQMDLKMSLGQAFSCQTHSPGKIGWRYDLGSVSNRRSETSVHTFSNTAEKSITVVRFHIGLS